MTHYDIFTHSDHLACDGRRRGDPNDFLLWPVRFISPFLFSTGAIVGGVVGAVLFFLFVGAVSFICWQNSKKKKNTNIDVEPEIGNLIN